MFDDCRLTGTFSGQYKQTLAAIILNWSRIFEQKYFKSNESLSITNRWVKEFNKIIISYVGTELRFSDKCIAHDLKLINDNKTVIIRERNPSHSNRNSMAVVDYVLNFDEIVKNSPNFPFFNLEFLIHRKTRYINIGNVSRTY